jgi:lipopolysaccharide transport system ATP-binding protein
MTAVLTINNLAKCYRVQSTGKSRSAYGYRTLRDDLMNLAKAPMRWFGNAAAPTVEDFWALRDVSFEVQRGDVLGVIGHNGAGKSTLLKILSRITKPTSGEARLHGRVGSLLEVGTGFHPELTGRENIFLNGAILGMRRHEILQKFDQIVEFAEIEQFLDTPVKR